MRSRMLMRDEEGAAVVEFALSYAGYPYVYAGEWYAKTPAGYCCGAQAQGGFDCSGFSMYVFAQVGVSLPHHAASQYGYGVYVSREQLAPGDLDMVFFNLSTEGNILRVVQGEKIGTLVSAP